MTTEKVSEKRDGREQAFILLFEKCFSDITIDEIIENAKDCREIKISDFTLNLVKGVDNNIDEIDNIIEENLTGWKLNRLSKINLTILRISAYEICKDENTPVSVSINEAILLAKQYSTDKDAAFINGVLGSIAKKSACDKKEDKKL